MKNVMPKTWSGQMEGHWPPHVQRVYKSQERRGSKKAGAPRMNMDAEEKKKKKQERRRQERKRRRKESVQNVDLKLAMETLKLPGGLRYQELSRQQRKKLNKLARAKKPTCPHCHQSQHVKFLYFENVEEAGKLQARYTCTYSPPYPHGCLLFDAALYKKKKNKKKKRASRYVEFFLSSHLPSLPLLVKLSHPSKPPSSLIPSLLPLLFFHLALILTLYKPKKCRCESKDTPPS